MLMIDKKIEFTLSIICRERFVLCGEINMFVTFKLLTITVTKIGETNCCFSLTKSLVKLVKSLCIFEC